ncbi:MAG: hypothetical protein C0518_00290 [Opitutus sp.]|nr:hypothetical protein [Opitutus sp.]
MRDAPVQGAEIPHAILDLGELTVFVDLHARPEITAPRGPARGKKRPLASAGSTGINSSVSGAPTTAFRLFPWLRYGVSVSVLGWVAWQIDWRELGGLAAIDWPLAFPAVLLAGIAYPLQAWRWQGMLAAQGLVLRPARVHVLFWIGNFYNCFLPGGIAGDGFRLLATWRTHPGQKAAAGVSIVADRAIGLCTLFGLAVLALGGHLAIYGGNRQLETVLFASAGALIFLSGGTILVMHSTIWEGMTRRILGDKRTLAIRVVVDALARNPGALGAATALSLMVWLIDFAALWLIAQAVGLDAGPLALAVAAAAAYVAAALPISVGGHGVREGTLVLVLGWIGIGMEAGQADQVRLLAISFWAVSTGWSLAGALTLWLEPRLPP